MGLGIAEEHVALAGAVRGWAAREGLRAAARAAAENRPAESPLPETGRADGPAEAQALPTWWAGAAGLGLLSLPADAGLVEVAVVVEELGRELAPGPYLPTVLAGLLLRQAVAADGAAAGDPAGAAADLQRRLGDGSAAAAVGLGRSSLAGERTGDTVTVSGTAELVLGAGAADVLVLPVEVDGSPTWLAVDAAAATYADAPGIDPTRPAATVTLERATVPAGRELAGLRAGLVTDLAAVLLAAEAAGVAGWCLDTAVEHAKVREQFGRPIGSFQAVKHRCADLLAEVELARAAAWDAARAGAADPDGPGFALCAAVAAAVCLQAAVDAAKGCIQVLGGIGYTWEHDAHLYLKRAVAARQLLGGTATWRRRAAAAARGGVRRQRTLELPADAERHRTEVRVLLAGLTGLDPQEQRRRVADAGYLVPHWPAPYGRGAGAVEQVVIDEEFAAAGVQRPDLVIGNWALPTILQYGTDEQRARFVPPTLYGELTWCQMFSEPGAGSDLASLQTKAARVEGGWSLSGQKVWTSTAQHADWAICLARTGTGTRRHEGITYFLVDMRTPGIDVRPLRELTGEALFNEVFLTDVFVPDDCVVGEVGDGWRLARTTLANERVAMSSGAAFPSGVEQLLDALEASDARDDAGALERVGHLVCRAHAESMLGLRATLAQVSGTDPGAASSVRKLVGMHLRQDAAELALELLGPGAVTAEGPAAEALHRFLATRALTIAGGTSEVLHNVIGERILGLPRA